MIPNVFDVKIPENVQAMLDFLWQQCLEEQVVDVRRTTDLDLDNDDNADTVQPAIMHSPITHALKKCSQVQFPENIRWHNARP